MGEFYRIRTRHGTWLGVDAESGKIVCRNASDTEAEPRVVAAYVSELRPNVCFLFADRSGVDRLLMHPDLDCDTIPAAWPCATAAGTQGVAVPPRHGQVALCGADCRGRGSGGVAADREKIRAFEELALVPAQTDLIAPETRALAARLDAILAVPLTVGLIMSLAPRDAPILQAVGRLLPPARLAALARSLLACPAACRKLAQLFPDDLLGTLGLPWLAEWEARRASPEGELQNWQMTLGVETDHFSVAGQNGQYVSFPYACTVLARRTVEPRRDVCIIATARNEGLYLLEWIAYHRAIGIEEFFLHTNDNDDGSDELLAALARGGAIHWIDSKVTPGVTSPQFKAYGHALAVRPEILDFRWALIVDLDEYMVLNPTRFSRVQDFLAWQEADPVDAIGLS